MSLGLHAMADGHKGELPGCVPSNGSPYPGDPLVMLLPYVEQTNMYNRYMSLSFVRQIQFSQRMQVAIYVNPADRSFCALNPNLNSFPQSSLSDLSVSSYALNEQLFRERPKLSQVTDGLSQTIWIAEHYGWNCNGTTFFYPMTGSDRWAPLQPPTFAHSMADGRPQPGDYSPITSGNPPQSTTQDGRLFQVAPSLSDCDPRLPNASSSGGLQVGLGDGSVRILAPSISPTVFWGAVTPNKGEVISFD
jgi:hypothetical protein